MSSIQYAVQVDLTNATADLPSAGIDYSPALGYSVMRIITGRPDYDGTQIGITYENTDANTDVWHEDLLIENGMSNPSRRVDLQMSGDYGTFSGFNFTMNNAIVAGVNDPLWDIYKDNDVYFTGQTVRLWAVIGTVFYQLWQGIVYNNPYNEIDYKFVCKDAFYNVHKNIPPVVVADSNYPNANEDSKGGVIPVAFGDVPYSETANIEGNVKWIPFATRSPSDNHVYSFPITTVIKTSNRQTLVVLSGRFFAMWQDAFGDQLVGYYLFNIAGTSNDSNRGIKILSSTATTSTAPSGSTIWEMNLVLEEPFEEEFVSANFYDGSPDDDTAWFRVGKLNLTYAVSNESVREIVNSNGQAEIYEFDETNKRYATINQITSSFDLTDSNENNVPYIDITSSNISKSGDVEYLEIIPYDTFDLQPSTILTGKVGVDSNLTDFDRTTNVTFDVLPLPISWQELFTLGVRLSNEVDYSQYTDMYLGVDIDMTGLTSTLQYRIIWDAIDAFGNAWNLQSEIDYPNAPYADILGDVNFLPNEYYVFGDDNSEPSKFALIEDFGGGDNKAKAFIKIPDNIKSKVSQDAIVDTMQMRLDILHDVFLETGAFEIKQIGLFGSKSVSLLSDKTYVRLQGEEHDGNRTNTVFEAYRHILEDYDGLTLNASEFLGDYDIDINRGGWHVGRTITERKNSFEYLKQLAQDSFTVIFPSRYGKRRVRNWLEQTTVLYDFNDDPTGAEIGILRNSVSKYERTTADKIFNEYQINYNWSAGHKKHTRSYVIGKVDQDTFPASNENWNEYVSGDITYADARAIWQDAHEIYIRYGMVRQFERNLDWYIDVREFDSGATQFVGTSSSAYMFLALAVAWIGRQKGITEFRIPLNSDTVDIDLTDYSIFNDAIYTNGIDKTGYIQKIEYDTKNDQIIIGAILNPDDDIDDVTGDIIESGSQPDTITESGSQPDTITEGA